MTDTIPILKSPACIIGLGYVGYPLAQLLASNNHDVTGIDINVDRLHAISSKPRNSFTTGVVHKGVKLSNNPDLIKDASTVVICVPTPVHSDKTPNYEYLTKATTVIGNNLQPGQLIILESTVSPGTCDDILIPILEKVSGLQAGTDFYVAHCPERINPGDSYWNTANIPRIVGGINQKSLDKALEFYSSFLTSALTPVATLKEAEAVKIVENCFRDINIAFVNELAVSFSKQGINIINVINAAATKPFAFLPHYPGMGVGGHCIPVDPYYLIEKAKDYGFDHSLLTLARKINSDMPAYTVQLIQEGLEEIGLPLADARIAVLGLSYKANIEDDRESPSHHLLAQLQQLTNNVIAYDPFHKEKSANHTLASTLAHADVIVIATAHDEFVSIPTIDFKKHSVRLIVDGRNCLNKHAITQAGIGYKGVGI